MLKKLKSGIFFPNGRLPQNLKFSLYGLELKVIDNFTFLGITLSKTCNFNFAKRGIVGRKHNLSIPGQLNLFDTMVKYGVMEIVKSFMIYGELC